MPRSSWLRAGRVEPGTLSGVEPLRWAVVVPVKELPVAKTRLALAPDERADLALAMARDVVAAALGCPAVDGVVVVTNDLRAAAALDLPGTRVVADTEDAGLNPALADGARLASGWWPRAGVAALSSDLPCARPADLAAALETAAAYERAVLADVRGDGTTLLTARPGVALDPRYGPSSRHAHVVSGAAALPPGRWPALERDVDTPADLDAALALGVGAFTQVVLESRR
jgi:2-phospho-L-lactate guanylyltransferase